MSDLTYVSSESSESFDEPNFKLTNYIPIFNQSRYSCIVKFIATNLLNYFSKAPSRYLSMLPESLRNCDNYILTIFRNMQVIYLKRGTTKDHKSIINDLSSHFPLHIIENAILKELRDTQNKAYSQLVDPKINIDQKNHDFEKEKIPNINDEIVDEHQQRLPIHLQNDLQTQITPAIKIEENKNMDLENSFLQDVKLRLDSDAIEKSYSKKFKSEKNSSSGLIVKDEYKGKTKLERNRKSARECRNRKKTYIKNLEIQVCCLQEERSEERRVGKEGLRRCRYRCAPYP